MSKNLRDDLRKDIRPITKVVNINTYQKDPNYVYRVTIDGQASNNETFESNMDDAFNNGWEVCYDTDGLGDDRLHVPESSESRAPSPVIKKMKGGQIGVLMRRRKDIDEAARLAASKRDDERYAASATRNKDRIVKKGNQISIVGSEINESNIDKQLD